MESLSGSISASAPFSFPSMSAKKHTSLQLSRCHKQADLLGGSPLFLSCSTAQFCHKLEIERRPLGIPPASPLPSLGVGEGGD